MATGPGKYDDECTVAREATSAETAVLIVINGARGTGFSVQTTSPRFLRVLPAILRDVAMQIEKDTP